MRDIDNRYNEIEKIKDNFHKRHRKPFSASFFIALTFFIVLFVLYIMGYLF